MPVQSNDAQLLSRREKKACPLSPQATRLDRRQRSGFSSNHDEQTEKKSAFQRGSFLTTTAWIGPYLPLHALAPEGPEHRGMHHDQHPGNNTNPHRGQIDSH